MHATGRSAPVGLAVPEVGATALIGFWKADGGGIKAESADTAWSNLRTRPEGVGLELYNPRTTFVLDF
jgi:hypothetical protein